MLPEHTNSVSFYVFSSVMKKEANSTLRSPFFQSENYKEAMEMWDEAKKDLPQGTVELAQPFVDYCIQVGAFVFNPGCHIEALDSGRVIFDWNNGQLPVFTVIISERIGFVFSGISSKTEEKGTASDLKEVTGLLPEFVETGQQLWPKHVLLDSSLKRKSVLVAALQGYTPLQPSYDCRYSPAMGQSGNTCSTLAFM